VTLYARRSTGTIEFAVSDAGPGIPQPFADRAFERFTRGDPARSEPGAGLGLAIVKLVAQAHGGEPYIAQDATRCEVGMRIPVRPSEPLA